MILQKVNKFIDSTLIDLGRQFRWSYLPPLMVYVAAGISGLTGIVGILIVSFGLLLLTFRDIKNKINLDVLKLALIISFTISLYTLCDAAGVRSVDNNFSYIVWLFVLDGWLIFAYVYYKNKNDLFKKLNIS